MAPPFLISALDSECSDLRLDRFTPGERARGTYWMKGWFGTRSFCKLRSRGKYIAPAGNRTPAVWPVVRRYTD
jgi:hypothetical protein